MFKSVFTAQSAAAKYCRQLTSEGDDRTRDAFVLILGSPTVPHLAFPFGAAGTINATKHHSALFAFGDGKLRLCELDINRELMTTYSFSEVCLGSVDDLGEFGDYRVMSNERVKLRTSPAELLQKCVTHPGNGHLYDSFGLTNCQHWLKDFLEACGIHYASVMSESRLVSRYNNVGGLLRYDIASSVWGADVSVDQMFSRPVKVNRILIDDIISFHERRESFFCITVSPIAGGPYIIFIEEVISPAAIPNELTLDVDFMLLCDARGHIIRDRKYPVTCSRPTEHRVHSVLRPHLATMLNEFQDVCSRFGRGQCSQIYATKVQLYLRFDFFFKPLTALTRSNDARDCLPRITGRHHIYYRGILGSKHYQTFSTEEGAQLVWRDLSGLWAWVLCDDVGRILRTSGLYGPEDNETYVDLLARA